jgi:hypothetical protein
MVVYWAPMAQHTKVVVYVPAAAARALRRDGQDPAEWVRNAVRRALTELGRRNGGDVAAEFSRTQPARPNSVSDSADGVGPAGGVAVDETVVTGSASTGDPVPPASSDGENVKGCVDHRGDPYEFCEACLAMEAT